MFWTWSNAWPPACLPHLMARHARLLIVIGALRLGVGLLVGRILRHGKPRHLDRPDDALLVDTSALGLGEVLDQLEDLIDALSLPAPNGE